MKRIAGLLTLAMLSACSGGGSGARVAPTTPFSASNGSSMNSVARSATVKIAFTVPAGLGRSVMGRTMLAGTGNVARSLLYTSPSVLGAIAVQLCHDTGETGNGTTSCANGTIFTLDFDVTNPAVCPAYNPTTPFPCSLTFPAGKSVGSQFELDLYDTKPVGGTNGVGGVITKGIETGQTDDGSCGAVGAGTPGAACMLGAGLSDPDLVVPLAANTTVGIKNVEGFLQIIETAPNAGFPAGPKSDGNNGNGFGRTFVASEPGNALGSDVSGSAMSLGFDAQHNQITGSSCVQGSPDEYANALTPAADEAPSPSPGANQFAGNVGSGLYFRDNGSILSTTTGQGALNAAHLNGTEDYDGASNPLTSFSITPCLIGGPGGPVTFGPSLTGKYPGTPPHTVLGEVNFPADTIDFQYDGSGGGRFATPGPTQVGTLGASSACLAQPAINTPPQTGCSRDNTTTTVDPYFSRVTGDIRSYVGYEQNNPLNPAGAAHAVEAGAGVQGDTPSAVGPNKFQARVTLVFAPLWGELTNPSTPAWCAFPTCQYPNGSFTNSPAVWNTQQGSLLVNLKGTNSSIQVNALQDFIPANGVYKATLPFGCAGIVGVGSTIGNLFDNNGGFSWIMLGGGTAGSCFVTYTDGFNSFQVQFTNDGTTNPGQPPPPTPPTVPGGSSFV